MAMLLIAIGLGGCAGALARYGLGRWAARRWPSPFPWGTFGINISGALLLGFLTGLSAGARPLPPLWRQALGTGFLGAYTTFSTWQVETLRLLHGRRPVTAAANIALSVGAGIGAAWAGLLLGRHT
jgi:CrcB protein